MQTFLISDLHLGHDNARRFTRFDGKLLRNFDSKEEMNEAIIANINAVVGPKDRLYICGDVAIKRSDLHMLGRINGRKVLIRGNHDIFKLQDYTPYFDDIRGSHKLDNYIVTHIPIHIQSVSRWCEGNIHGHLHYNWVGEKFSSTRPMDIADLNYFNVSCELLRYKPIEFSELKKVHTLLRERGVWTIADICKTMELLV